MAIPKDIKILPAWDIVCVGDSQKLRAELLQELPSGHVLTGLDLIAVARRFDQDDVLFEVVGPEPGLAQVHLTWQKEKEPTWPRTKLFRNWEQWSTETMLPDHQERMLSEDLDTKG